MSTGYHDLTMAEEDESYESCVDRLGLTVAQGDVVEEEEDVDVQQGYVLEEEEDVDVEQGYMAAATAAALAKIYGADITVVGFQNFLFPVIHEKLKESLPEHDSRLSFIHWHLSKALKYGVKVEGDCFWVFVVVLGFKVWTKLTILINKVKYGMNIPSSRVNKARVNKIALMGLGEPVVPKARQEVP
ncbi:hypothetical protein RHGRI_022612 [Rhododendron griersonianum]|uniref:Uncharacterized protein n=1 Tax=Rhododendron griersonianum TaxID=479676 RepID=A0AAV6J0G6_9ERIC|nr:hypothetical protein RHGRI_022612 [Rhododendron griersonianum]